MDFKLILLLFCNIIFTSVFSQDDKHDHDHRNEIGMAHAPVYFLGENQVSYGLHFHYVHVLGESRFGLGAGYERIFDEHRHNTVSVVGAYRPIDEISLNISPGIAFEDGSPDILFAVHLEGSYEFEVGDFHIGPVLEYAYDIEDSHLSAGLHLGYGF